MDFSLGSMGVYSNNVGANEMAWDSMTSELADSRQHQQQRMQLLSDAAISPNAAADHGLVFSSSLKQRRSATDLSSDPRDECNAGSFKLARTDHHSFSNRSQADVSVSLPPLRNSMPCSPSTPRSSEDALLTIEPNLVADARLQLLRGGEPAAYVLAGSRQAPPRCFPSFQNESYVQQYMPTSGLPLVMGRGGLIHEAAVVEGRQLFTAAQWTELEHQALIYKYLMHGAPVPHELLLALRRSLAASISAIPLSSHSLSSGGWGSFQLGVSGNADPEPGRCRRTDGKKWRCARPVVAEQKYCERHMHRGRHRKKAAEAAAAAAAAAAALSPSPTTNAAPPQTSKREDASPNFPISQSQLKQSSIASSPHHTSHPNTSNLSAQTLAGSGGMGIGTAAGFAAPLHSASSLPSNKDNRFLSGLNKAEFSLRQEQFASDLSARMHGFVDPLHFSASMPVDRHISWNVQQPSKFPLSASLKPNYSFWFQQNSDQYMKCFQGSHEEMAMANARKLNTLPSHHHHHQQHQQNRPPPPSLFSTEALEDNSQSQGQPLRHFFDDWPRTRDLSTLSWPDAEEEKLKLDALSPQLSISIPANSTEISASDRTNRGKAMLSSISLSTLRNSDDVADPTHMGLGISSTHRQSWFPRTMDDAVGGPLAEALQSSAPHSGEKVNESFAKEEWNNKPHITSPTGVLQKVTLGTCFSDCSSNASSPGSVRTEHANAENQRLPPVLTNCSSRLST